MPTDPFFPPDGVVTFARAPLIHPGDPADADAVVLGVPIHGLAAGAEEQGRRDDVMCSH